MTDPIGGAIPLPALSGDTGQAGVAPAAEGPAAANAAVSITAPPGDAKQASAQEMQALAAALNQHVQDLQTSLHFQVDKITGQMVLSVIDTQNNQVLMQVPSPEALAIAQSLQRFKLQLMNQTA